MKEKDYIKRLLNDEQLSFVKSDNNLDVLVSASAGTGKTSSMISKILYLIVQKDISLENLLILTYTDAAASEMKVKLYKKLHELLIMSNNAQLKKRLLGELDLLQGADVGTSHSFCKKLITKYFYVVGVDPAFTLILEKEKAYLFDQALTNVFNKYVTKNDIDFFELFESYNTKRDTSALKEIVINIYEHLKTIQDKEKWKENLLQNTYNPDISKNTCAQYTLDYCKKEMKKIDASLQEYLDRAVTLDCERVLKFLYPIRQVATRLANTNSYLELQDLVHHYKYVNRPNPLKNSTIDEIELYDDLIEFNENFKEVRNEWKSIVINESEKQISSKLLTIKSHLTKILEIVDRVEVEYARLKALRHGLDFNDLEKYAIELLKENTVIEEIREQYEYIFFDEYQDVNSIQEQILQSIKKPSNLIMIGDVKQSIYKFRGSQPKNFIDKYNNSQHSVFNFFKNYRSENNILQFVNKLFSPLITPSTVGVNYGDWLLETGKEVTNHAAVSMDILNTGDASERVKKNESSLAEGNLVINKISEYILAGYTYKDIAILQRNRSSLPVLYKVLKEHNVPLSVQLKSDLFSQYEIILLISFLRVLNNFQDDLSLACVLKSFMVGLDENQLAQIKLQSNESSFWENIINYDIKDAIYTKLQKLKSDIEYFKSYLLQHTIYEALEHILLFYNFHGELYSLPDGSEIMGNINEFLALSLNDNYAYSLLRFLNYINSMEKSNQTLTITDGDNCIKIMTIHASKGLDFPCVIITDMGVGFNFGHNHNIYLNDEFGVGLKYINNITRVESASIVGNACKLTNKRSQIVEEICLFYVALTRAKSKLHLIGSYNLEKLKIPKSVYGCKSYLDMFFMTISANTLNAFLKGNSFIIDESKPSACHVNIHSIDDIVDNSIAPPALFLSGENTEMAARLNNFFDFKYPFALEKEIAIKNSVTSILKEDQAYEKTLSQPLQFKINESVENKDALLLGSLYHRVMEQLTYNEDHAQITKIIKQSASENSEWQHLESSINASEIEAAINTINAIKKDGDLQKEKQFILSMPHCNLVKNSNITENIIVQGVIDLIIDYGDYAIIIDFKTNKNTREKDLIKMYSLQLNMYAKAFESAYKKPVKHKYVYSFALNKLINI